MVVNHTDQIFCFSIRHLKNGTPYYVKTLKSRIVYPPFEGFYIKKVLH